MTKAKCCLSNKTICMLAGAALGLLGLSALLAAKTLKAESVCSEECHEDIKEADEE